MNEQLPDHVNAQRRHNLTRYTLLAILVYHIPITAAYFAVYFGLAQYSYGDVNLVYSSIVPSNIIILTLIRFKGQITRSFIQTMLYTQVAACVFFMALIFHYMHGLRYLALLASLIPLIFVFIQARLLISFFIIAVSAAVYLSVSYVSYRFLGQNPKFGEDCLAVYIFLPTSAFTAFMCSILQKQRREIKQSRDTIKTTFADLENTHRELESYHQRMLESLHYAEMIQRSHLPGIDRLKAENPESLIIWMPKDIVGGDIFYTFSIPGSTIIALMDCTGHGVPGAFLTLIAYTEIRKIILELKEPDPSEILGQLNRAMKNVLHKNPGSNTNDGLDAAIIHVDYESSTIRFASARIPLFYVEDRQVHEIKGSRHSIGYVDSDENFSFALHTLNLRRGSCVYLKTDGYTDQLGGGRKMRFGTPRFKEMLLEIHSSSFTVQRQEIIRNLNDYKKDYEQLDDITVIGFRI